MLLRFGEFEIDTTSAELRGPAGPVQIEPKAYDLLLLLAENPGRVISRDEMIERVWHGRIVSDSAVLTALKLVRRAIDDDGIGQRFLKTVRSRGHRFTSDVRIALPALSASPIEPTTEAPVASGQPTLAVLPFRAFARGPILGALVEAVPAEIISALSRLRWLRVLARESSFRFRTQDLDIPALRSVLGAGYVLSGTLELSGRNIAVGVDLADTRSSAVIWSDRVSGSIDDIHAIRHRIVEEVTAALDLQIPLNEANIARLRTSESLDAWGAYHLGMAHAFRFNRRDNEIAAGLFARAVHLDPQFAAAFAGLSFTSFQDAFMGFEENRAAAIHAARTAAEHSVELDPLDPQSNAAMGRLGLLEGIGTGWVEWMERSISLAPSYAKGHYSRALLNACAGNTSTALLGVDRAKALSPLDPMLGPMLITSGVAHVIEGEFERAADMGSRAAAVTRHHAIAHMAAAAFNMLSRREAEATRLARLVQARRSDISIRIFANAIPVADEGYNSKMHGALQTLGFRD